MSDKGDGRSSATLERASSAESVSGSRPTGEVPADLVGRTLLHFRVVQRLGEGGMGVVYRAIDEKLRRPVALKVLAAKYVVDERNKEMIFREARSAAGLTHANICAIYEVHDLPEVAFYVMELVEGETLRARIARSERLSVEEALRLGGQIARALARAHEAGVVHRDLKADNVMITEAGDVKLLDFGLAKVLDVDEPSLVESGGDPSKAPGAFAPTMHASARGTEHGRVMGTPAYMAPEQARGETVDARADVFAFGVVLYEMLTGAAPYSRASDEPWLWGDGQSVDWRVRVPIRQLSARVPRRLEELVSRCMAFEARDRFADGAALLGAVEECARRGARGGRSRLAGIVAIVTVAAGVLGGVEWRVRRASVRPAAIAAPVEMRMDAPLAFAEIQPSPTNDPAAHDAYRLAMKELAGSAYAEASRHLDGAIARDPAFASAHLQRAYVEYRLASSTFATMRSQFAAAAAQRAALSTRDAELLEALSPALSDPQDWTEAQRRLEAMTSRRTGDAQAWDALGVAYVRASRNREAIAAFRREAAMDTTSSLGLSLEAQLELSLDDVVSAHRSLEECTRRVPTAVDCRVAALRILAASGDCTAMDRAAREVVAMAPESPSGYAFRIDAQGGLRAPVETIGALFAQKRDHDPTSTAPTRLLDDARVATWSGDFATAVQRADEAERVGDSSTVPDARAWKIYALHEMGRDAEAGRVAVDMLRRAAAFSPMGTKIIDDWTMDMLVEAQRARALPEVEFRRRRDAWVEAWHSKLGEEGWKGVAPVIAWWKGYALAAATEQSAREALDWLGDFGPLPPVGAPHFPFLDAAVGETYRLAGRLEEAGPRLESATRWCSLDPTAVVSALDLGRLREALGDLEGACAAYARVLEAWGGARPHSITADEARIASGRCRCPASSR